MILFLKKLFIREKYSVNMDETYLEEIKRHNQRVINYYKMKRKETAIN